MSILLRRTIDIKYTAEDILQKEAIIRAEEELAAILAENPDLLNSTTILDRPNQFKHGNYPDIDISRDYKRYTRDKTYLDNTIFKLLNKVQVPHTIKYCRLCPTGRFKFGTRNEVQNLITSYCYPYCLYTNLYASSVFVVAKTSGENKMNNCLFQSYHNINRAPSIVPELGLYQLLFTINKHEALRLPSSSLNRIIEASKTAWTWEDVDNFVSENFLNIATST